MRGFAGVPGELTVLACGNPSRGDDALGPSLLGYLSEKWARHPDWDGLTLIQDYQLQVEHAMDLRDQGLVLFIDASVSCRRPYEFTRVSARRDTSYTSHAMTPAAVLYAFREVYHEAAPPSFVLSVRGIAFELGQPLSDEGRSHLSAARELLDRLLGHPTPEAWEVLAASPGSGTQPPADSQ